MRILVVSAMFPPNVLGGAEISAYNLTSWLLKQGHEIGVLMAAKAKDEEKFGEMVEGMKVWSLFMPRPYPIFKQGRDVSSLLKPLWHLQDHLDPRNATMVGRVLDEFKPDFCNVHYLTGIGHNALAEIGKRDIPMMYVMPDMTLSCLRATMFVDGKTCEAQCGPCKVSAAVKRRGVRAVRRIGFSSPSLANLEQNAKFQPLKQYPHAHILNANKYPKPTAPRPPSDTVRFIYAGRLHPSKGVDLLLSAAEQLRERWDFSFAVVGGGSEEGALRERFGHHDWVTFTGQVPLQEAIDRIGGSDMLCIPSVWLENSPGVVIQALGMSVPVMGSEVGGIPELVRHDENGLLVPPGDQEAWRSALELILKEPDRLKRYQNQAAARAGEFEQDYLGQRYLRFIDEIRSFPGADAAGAPYRPFDRSPTSNGDLATARDTAALAGPEQELAGPLSAPLRPRTKGRLHRWLAPVAGLVLAVCVLSRSYGTETRQVVVDPAVSVPVRTEPLIIGANVHYGLRRVLGYFTPEIALEAFKELEVDSFRDYFPWQSFVFEPSGVRRVYSQRLVEFLNRTPLLPVLNLGFANAGVPGGVPPLSSEGLESFTAYVRAVEKLTARYKPIYEIWNEWNLYSGVGPMQPRLKGAGDPADPRASVHYIPVAKAAVQAIREADPDARILVGTVGEDRIGSRGEEREWEWTQAVVRGGIMEGATGLSVHLYNQCSPRRLRHANEMIRRVSLLQEELKKQRGGVETPIYITEFGWPTFRGGCGLELDTAGHNMAQFILLSAAIGWIKGIWVHSLKDVGPDPDDMEHHFGLFTYDNKPKPAVCFFREASRIVREADSIVVEQPFEDVFVAVARKGSGQKVILWTSSRFVEASYSFPDTSRVGQLMCGDEVNSRGGVAAALTPQPVIFNVAGNAPVAIDIVR